MLVSLLSCKIVGLEMTGLLQLAYFSLADQDFMPLYLAPFAGMREMNGLNLAFFDEEIQLPLMTQELGVSAAFLNNCNLMVLLMFCVGVVGLVLYQFGQLLGLDKCKYAGTLLLKQGLLTLMIFNALNLAFSAGIHWKYASEEEGALIIWSSVILYMTIVLLVVMVFAF